MRISRLLIRAMLIVFLFTLIRFPAPAADGQRNFIVVFEIRNYTGDLGDAVKYIFSDLLRSGDQLIVYTPAKVYGFSKATLARPQAELVAMLQEKLRSDTALSATGFAAIAKDMKSTVQNIENYLLGGTGSGDSGGVSAGKSDDVDLKNNLANYRQFTANLMQLRRVNDQLLRQMLGVFRSQPGSNHLIVIYEQELRPIPQRRAMDVLREDAKLSFMSQELFAQQSTKPPFDAEAFASLCAQVPLTAHFLYFKPKTGDSLSADFFDNSGDMYGAFGKVTGSTGGVNETVGEVKAGLKTIVNALKATK
jgi:hypothetical protein